MKVIAAEGMQCPKEGKPREYITDDKAVDVPDTIYYRRLLADGSLVFPPSFLAGRGEGRGVREQKSEARGHKQE